MPSLPPFDTAQLQERICKKIWVLEGEAVKIQTS